MRDLPSPLAGFGSPFGEVSGGNVIVQPIVLTSPLGVVFVTASGDVLTRGTQIVEEQGA